METKTAGSEVIIKSIQESGGLRCEQCNAPATVTLCTAEHSDISFPCCGGYRCKMMLRTRVYQKLSHKHV